MIAKGDRVRVLRGPHKGVVGVVRYEPHAGGAWLYVALEPAHPCPYCQGTGLRQDTVTVDPRWVEEVLL